MPFIKNNYSKFPLPTVICLVALWICFPACHNINDTQQRPSDVKALTSDLIILHAGSLAVPFRELADSFKTIYPDVRILLESGGSVANARKIIDLNRSSDIIAVSDYKVIDEMLIPEYALWNIKFAANEMVIAYTDRSRDITAIDSVHWYDMLLKEGVRYGRSDPNQDPCGYRTMHTLLLAENHYAKPGLCGQITSKDRQYIRPKEVDLLALLETQTVDFIFIYRSVAHQHRLPFITLPDEINLKDPALAGLYNTVAVRIRGNQPDDSITMSGEPMLYSMTILNSAPHPEAAMAFAGFLLSQAGMSIMEQNGQPAVVPAVTGTYEQIPDQLKKFALKGSSLCLQEADNQ